MLTATLRSALALLAFASLAACGSDAAPKSEATDLTSELRAPGELLLQGSEIFVASSDPRGVFAAMPRVGGAIRELDDVGEVTHLELSEGFLYFVEGGSALRRVIVAGGDSASIALKETSDFAAVGARVFATSAGSNEMWSIPNQGGAVRAVAGVTPSAPKGIVSDGSELFWIDSGSNAVHKGAIPAVEDEMSPSLVAGYEGQASGRLEIYAGALYFDASAGDSTILYQIASGATEASVIAEDAIEAFAIDGDFAYYATSADASDAGIYRVSLGDGGTPEWIAEISAPVEGLVADGEKVYWSEPSANLVRSAAL